MKNKVGLEDNGLLLDIKYNSKIQKNGTKKGRGLGIMPLTQANITLEK